MKKLMQSIGFASLVKCSTIFKMSFIVGSRMIFLSASSIFAPLAGAFGGVFGSNVLCATRLALHFLFFKSISLSFLAFCIPGYCASLYWATRSSLIRLFLPLACMVLFIAHPVGAQAFVYSLYWLIPVVLFFVPSTSLFLTALGSTFVAHAVGSVIWLYTVPMTPVMWLGLIPVVAIERLLFASGMVVVYHAAMWIKSICTLPYTSRMISKSSGDSA